MPVDLHTHSRHSDGSDTAEEVVRAAAHAGLAAVALTDHDTLSGVAEARAEADRVGIGFVPGTELSVEWATGAMHLLVYYLEPGPGPLQDELAALRSGRTARNREITAALRSLGMAITDEEVAAEAGSGVVGRPHIAAVLVAKGHVDTISSAFDRFLGAGRPAYRPRPRLTAERAIRLARDSGAVPVVAHPHTLAVSAADYADAFRDLTAVGLGGIEAHYAEYPPDLRRHLADLADELGIVATGGSDAHGRYKPGLAVGTGRGDLRVPDRAWEELAQARVHPSSDRASRR